MIMIICMKERMKGKPHSVKTFRCDTNIKSMQDDDIFIT